MFWYFCLSLEFVVVKVLKTSWLFSCFLFSFHAVFYFQKILVGICCYWHYFYEGRKSENTEKNPFRSKLGLHSIQFNWIWRCFKYFHCTVVHYFKFALLAKCFHKESLLHFCFFHASTFGHFSPGSRPVNSQIYWHTIVVEVWSKWSLSSSVWSSFSSSSTSKSSSAH